MTDINPTPVDQNEQLTAVVDHVLMSPQDSQSDPIRLAQESLTNTPAPIWQTPAVAGLLAGRYRMKRPIAVGGMGEVHEAEQITPVRRRVAIKFLRNGEQSVAALTRFNVERQALAQMEHPNIATVFDAGTSESGQPYFAMEYVEGLPITVHCRSFRVSIADRLDLFLQVCAAVQHAHVKGVIHRDLKPSNIMVESIDGQAVSKVIDFGLAKALGQPMSMAVDLTTVGQVLGTPLYMAPEQASGSSANIDTRADVYALGVILYELLTGTTPLDPKVLEQCDVMQKLRLIQDEVPPRPSVRLATVEVDPSVDLSRDQVVRQVRGDLDWIVLKALAKNRDQRYETVAAFADDLRRHLRHELVTAGPPSRLDIVRKFVRRNRTTVIATTLALGVFGLGVIGTAIGLVRALGAESETRLALDRVEQEQAKTLTALTEAKTAQLETRQSLAVATSARDQTHRTLDMVTSEVVHNLLLGRTDLTPQENEILKKLLDFYEQFALQNPEGSTNLSVFANGQLRIAEIRDLLGDRANAEVAILTAMALSEQLAARPDATFEQKRFRCVVSIELATLYVTMNKIPEAEKETIRGTAICEQLYRDFPTNPLALMELAVAHRADSHFHSRFGNRPQAIASSLKTIELCEEIRAVKSSTVEILAIEAESYCTLGRMMWYEKKAPEALNYYKKGLLCYESVVGKLPSNHRHQGNYAQAELGYAISLEYVKRFADAQAVYRSCIRRFESFLAQSPGFIDHRMTLGCAYVNLAATFSDTKQWREAIEWHTKGVEILSPIVAKLPTEERPRIFILRGLHGRARCHDRLGNYAPAALDYRRALVLATGDRAINIQFTLARCLARLGAHTEPSQVVHRLATTTDAEPWDFVMAAHTYAHCSQSPWASSALREDYAAKSLQWLKAAMKAGERKFTEIHTDPTLSEYLQRDEIVSFFSNTTATPTPVAPMPRLHKPN